MTNTTTPTTSAKMSLPQLIAHLQLLFKQGGRSPSLALTTRYPLIDSHANTLLIDLLRAIRTYAAEPLQATLQQHSLMSGFDSPRAAAEALGQCDTADIKQRLQNYRRAHAALLYYKKIASLKEDRTWLQLREDALFHPQLTTTQIDGYQARWQSHIQYAFFTTETFSIACERLDAVEAVIDGVFIRLSRLKKSYTRKGPPSALSKAHDTVMQSLRLVVKKERMCVAKAMTSLLANVCERNDFRQGSQWPALVHLSKQLGLAKQISSPIDAPRIAHTRAYRPLVDMILKWGDVMTRDQLLSLPLFRDASGLIPLTPIRLRNALVAVPVSLRDQMPKGRLPWPRWLFAGAWSRATWCQTHFELAHVNAMYRRFCEQSVTNGDTSADNRLSSLFDLAGDIKGHLAASIRKAQRIRAHCWPILHHSTRAFFSTMDYAMSPMWCPSVGKGIGHLAG